MENDKVFLEDRPIIAWSLIIVIMFLLIMGAIWGMIWLDSKLSFNTDNKQTLSQIDICKEKCWDDRNWFKELTMKQCVDMCGVLYD